MRLYWHAVEDDGSEVAVDELEIGERRPSGERAQKQQQRAALSIRARIVSDGLSVSKADCAR